MILTFEERMIAVEAAQRSYEGYEEKATVAMVGLAEAVSALSSFAETESARHASLSTHKPRSSTRPRPSLIWTAKPRWRCTAAPSLRSEMRDRTATPFDQDVD